MSDFTPGFAARHNAAAAALVRAFPVEGLAESFVASRPGSAGPRPAGPRHFSPADPATRSTAGWNPLDPDLAADPFEAARAAGYAEGLAAATNTGRDGETRDRDLLTGLADQLAGAGRIDREGIARRLRQTVLALTRQLVGETGVSAELLSARIDAAAALLADDAEAALLRLHPDDVALVEGKLPAKIFAAGDASVARGCFVLESTSTIVEDGPDLWLDQLAQAIERVPLPGASC